MVMNDASLATFVCDVFNSSEILSLVFALFFLSNIEKDIWKKRGNIIAARGVIGYQEILMKPKFGRTLNFLYVKT